MHYLKERGHIHMKRVGYKFKYEYIVPLLLIILSIIGIQLSGLSGKFVINQVMTRYIRNGIMVLALIIPIRAGMGINFAVTVGAMITQGVIITLLNFNMTGSYTIILTIILNLILSVVLGYLIGMALNRAKGKEMITSIIIGFLANSIYQLIFLVGFGTVIPARNEEIILTRGIGVRNMVDLQAYRNILENIWAFKINGVTISLFMILVVFLFGGFVLYILNTKFGQKVKALGLSSQKAKTLGIDVDKVRIKVIILSTIIASLGQLFYVQNIGMLNVYTGHLNTDIFSSAALLAGGASIKDAKIRHGFLGLILFHTLFIVSPQAGQNFFNNSSLGEYFRSFIAYGTIAFALVMNIRRENNLIKD
jgi:simple sugar transport system permease protein